MSKVSIIVPVYKVEQYLARCIDSILAQTYKDWELLLIDDGSPDRSGFICDEYATKDPRIRVFHKENGGVSMARNYALDHLCGDYVTFVDSDDWIDKECLEMCVKEFKGSDFDMLQFGYRDISYDGKVLREKTLDSQTADLKTYLKSSFLVTVWGTIFRTSIIKGNNIRFDTSLKLAEDQLFIMQYMVVANSFKSVNNVYYNYFNNSNGAVKNSKSEDMIKSLGTLDNFVRRYPIFEIVCFPLFDNFLALVFLNGDICTSKYKSLYKRFYKNQEPNYILKKYSKLSVISYTLAYFVCYLAYPLRYKLIGKFR